MNIIRIDENNLVNGPGNRCVVWISGCEHKCPGCQNPDTHDYATGTKFGESHLAALEAQLGDPHIDGVTLTGGDPLAPKNRDGVLDLLKYIKEGHPEKNVWVWTGYLYEEVKDLELMNYVDVLVDGKFIMDLHPVRKVLRYRGSVNQRIIDVPKSKQSQSLVRWIDFDGWDSSQDTYKGKRG